MTECPLCRSDKVIKDDHIQASELVSVYKGVSDVRYLLNGIDDIGYFKCGDCDLRYFYPAVAGGEEFYDELQKNDWYYLDEKEEYNYVARYVPPESKILEIGGGLGAFSSYLDRCEYTGLEFSRTAINAARKEGIHLINETIQDHSGKRKAYYDVVCSFQVLEHIVNTHDFVNSAIAAVKVDGLFIVSVPSEDSFLKHVVNNCLNLPPHHVTRWSDDALTNLPRVFGNIETVKIHHESLQPIHLTWYLNTLVSSLLLGPKLIDFSLRRKLVASFSKLVTRLIAGRINGAFLANGHTVTVIYKRIR